MQIRKAAITMLMVVVAIIHILPLAGVFGASWIAKLYSIELVGNDIEILMRHRAVLFGMLGLFFAYAAFKPKYQPISFVAAGVSVIAFLVLALSVGSYNEAIKKVLLMDAIALACLLIAVFLFYTQKKL